MALGLGNNLIRSGGAGNADKLSLDLQFAADKTLTARKGPTPTFLRASGATQVNAAGLIEYAPENLLLKSEEFNDVYWTTTRASIATNATTSPDGTNTAEKLIADTSIANNHRVDRTSVVLSLNTVHTFSVYAKASEYSGLAIGVHPSFTDGVRFSLVGSGTVTSAPPGYTGTIQSLADGWYRCTATFTSDAATAANRVLIYAGQNGTTFLYTGNGTSGIFIWGAQLERSSTARAYIPTTTAAVYGPRFDHDPVSPFACKGLLIEEQRMNSATFSGALVNNVGWLLSQATSVVSGTGPDGNNAYELADDTSVANVHGILNSGGTTGTGAVSVVSGTTYTGSIFLKKIAGSVDWVQVTLGAGGFGTTQYANFNLATGQVGNFAGLASGTSPRIEAFPNGWYRCSISVTATTTTSTTFGTAIYSTNNTNATSRAISYNGNTANKVLAAMCQFEAGAFPTSYIPTTTGAVTRSADTCSITGSAFSGFYNPLEGTILAGYLFRTNSAGRPFYIGDGTSSTNTMEAFNGGSGVTSNVFSGGAQQYTRDVVATNNSMVKTALAVAVSNAMLAVNGTLATSGGGLMPVGVNQLIIGNRPDGARNINGHISVVRYFRKRLPNAKLQTLST